MRRPEVLVKENLLVPIKATQERINEIREDLKKSNNPIGLNGLFLMLVSYVESMKKEVLVHYLKYHPEKIDNKKRIEIDKSTLFKNENFSLTHNIVEEYINRIAYWRCKQLFYEALEIEKPNNGLNSQIKQIRNARNELVHKNLRPNYKHKEVYNLNHVNLEELNSYLDKYDQYLKHLISEISDKYSNYTKLNALKNLWYHTFQTPLCSNFEDYWFIDEEEDSIVGYKKPSQVKGLSKSEKFLLDMWRSQVSEYKVDFLNLASLDKNTQSKLHLLLKISNDLFLY
ncbi:hypothetical protein [Fodinibius sp. AD559]|uniref:hypothetical protein n=1 Tax=Fodinibius sp. AD559 TaxID=3424179 RepID=UPI004046F8D0